MHRFVAASRFRDFVHCLAAALALFTVEPPAWAQITAPVAITQPAYANNGGTVTLTTTSALPSGSSIIVVASNYATGISNVFGTPTCSDGNNNSYNTDASVAYAFLSRITICSTHALAAPLGINSTITVNWGATSGNTNNLAAQAFSVTGLASPALDQVASASGTTATPSSGSTPTTTQAYELVFGVILDDASISQAGFAPGSGYAEFMSFDNSPGTNPAAFGEYQIVTSTGAYSANATISSAPNNSWEAAVATYKGAPQTLAVSVTGSGTVSAGAVPAPLSGGISNCSKSGGACSASYQASQSVTLTAIVPAGQYLTWSGGCIATSATTATWTMGAVGNCTAAFAPNATTISLSSAGPNPSAYGQSVTFIATVAPVSPATIAPTGTVSFFNGSVSPPVLLGTSGLTGGVATFPTTSLFAGSNNISAQYNGDSNYPPPYPASNTVVQTVNPANQTITFTSTPPANPAIGSSYTPSATGGASGNAVTVTIDATSTPGTCSIAGGIVSFTGPGNCIVDANQAGSANYAAAPQVQQAIAVAAPLVALSALSRWTLMLLIGLLGLIGYVRVQRIY